MTRTHECSTNIKMDANRYKKIVKLNSIYLNYVIDLLL